MTSPSSGSNLPAKWDRESLDRILKRAAELQATERDTSESMTPDEVLKLGREVGIPTRYLQQAMLEEQVRPSAYTPSGLLDRVMGEAECRAHRVVRGEAELVEQSLVDWLEHNELLAIQRRQPGKISWEPLRGMPAALRRSAAALGRTQRQFMLNGATQVSAGIVSLEPGYCHVTITANLRSMRSGSLGGMAALGGLGVASAAVLTIMTPFAVLALVPIPLAIAAGYGVSRSYTGARERTQIGLERALDHLETHPGTQRRELPPSRNSVMGMIAEELRKALKP